MRLSTWINSLYICVLFSMSKGLIHELVYGSKHTLYCGDSDPNTPPGTWFHDKTRLGVYSRSYTITNATFEDDGEYQCRRNGADVFSSPLQVYVYGILHISPRNCDSISDGVCVKHVKRGEPVTLCTSHTTTPSTIPKGKHVIRVSSAFWFLRIGNDDYQNFYNCFYTSERTRCRYSTWGSFLKHYTNINDSCLTINHEQNTLTFFLRTSFPDVFSVTSQTVVFYVTYEGIPQSYGGALTLYCGDTNHNSPPGNWSHNGLPLGVYSRSYIITNATFNNDGEYQCRRNGTNVFSSKLQVDVYGLLNIILSNCNSVSEGACVKHIKTGQSVTLCISHTTTPPKIPPGKHVISVSRSFWSTLNEMGRQFLLYNCSNGSCTQRYQNVNYTRYSAVSNTCLTINNVQENEGYFFDALPTKFGFHSLFFQISLEDFNELYGNALTLFCGDSVPHTSPGDWYHNGKHLGVYNWSYTITNATFDDEGEYQCMRNGTNVFSTPLKVYVYGLIKFTPLNCNSMIDGICVKHVKRGQSVNLCTSNTTTPSTIPQGKHHIGVSRMYWLQPYTESGLNGSIFYTCRNGDCKPTHSIVNLTHHLDVSDSCFTIDNVQKNRRYRFVVYFNMKVAEAMVNFLVISGGINLLYGSQHTLHCGNSDIATTEGDWFHNDLPLGVYNRSYTIANARFSDDGEYQCWINETRVFSSPLQVYVHGLLNITPLDCDSKSEGVCVKYAKRGHPVTLCTKYTTTPSAIPSRKNVIIISNSLWLVNNGGVSNTLYNCSRGSCKPWSNSSDVNYTRYSGVSANCLTINDVQEDEVYVLQVYFSPITSHVSSVSFHMNYNGTGEPITSPTSAVPTEITVFISIFMITIAIVVVTIVVKRYKRSMHTETIPSEPCVPSQEAQFSRPSYMIVYGEKDVKRLEKIGRGSFWKVYRGKLSDSNCAIKKLRGTKKSGNRESLIQKIMKELDTWSSLNHPNILRLYGIYHEEEGVDSIPSLIVELLDRSLTDHVNATFNPRYRESLFPLKTKISILSQVAGALEYLHSHKSVVHGDLTANNVLLKENSAGLFTAKLTDFGMSRVLNERDNIMSSVQGTYCYMPPEVHNGGLTSTKVDIYSFGVLCVHVLSHKFPKPLYALGVDQSGTHVVVSEFNRFNRCLLDLTEDERLLEPLIEECLQYEPEDRLCPVEVIGQLDSVQGRLDLNERRPSTPNQTSPVVHQHFNGPVVSGCTITESNLNVQSVTDCNMNVSTEVEITPLTLNRVPQITSPDNHSAIPEV